MTRFLDTSALVKIYHEEEGSEHMMEIYDSSDTELMISELGVLNSDRRLCVNIVKEKSMMTHWVWSTKDSRMTWRSDMALSFFLL